MQVIWFLSQERNIGIAGFNRVVKKDGHTELWIKEVSGESRKLAEGQEAIQLEQALLDIVWRQTPAIITDGKGSFSTNVNLNTMQEEEVE